MKNITYIISDIDKALAFEWVASFIDKDKIKLNFVLLNSENSKLEEFLKAEDINVKRIEIKNRYEFFKAYIMLAVFLISTQPDIVHCHLRTAELIGIPVAFLLRIKRRIYTRHSSTYHHLYHPKGVWVDRVISLLATDIIAISQNVKNVLVDWEHVQQKKIKLIPHGFHLKLFNDVPMCQILAIKDKYNLPVRCTVIGIIARYTWWKGYEFSIPAIGKLMKVNPEVYLVIANANGNDKQAIKELLHKYIPKERFREIQFEADLPALYKIFNYYVHVPFDPTVEAFGQTYVEALASGIPSIFTLSGIAHEFIKDGYNALVVDYKNEDQIEESLKRLFIDENLKNNLIENGKDSIKNFSLEKYIGALENLYLN